MMKAYAINISVSLLLTIAPLHAELLDRARQQCQLIQGQCAQVLCNNSEDSRTRLSLFLDAQESAIRGLQSELLAAVQWRSEATELSRQMAVLRENVVLDQVLLPREESAIYSRIDAMEQQVHAFQSKLDASNQPELEAMSNQLAYDFKLLRILSRPPKIPRGQIVKKLRLHHEGWVKSIIVSADGSRVVSESGYKALVWDPRTSTQIMEFRGHGSSLIRTVSLSADGSRAVSVDQHGKALVWDTRTGTQITEFPGHMEADIRDVSLSADSSRAVSVDVDGKALVWDTRTGVQITEFRGHGGSKIASVSLSADGSRAVSVDEDGKALVWDARMGEQITELPRYGGAKIKNINLSADGSRAVSGDGDGQALVWDARTGEQITAFLGHLGHMIFGVSLSADGSRAVSVGMGGKAMLWDARSGELIRAYPKQSKPISSVAWDEVHGRFYFGLEGGRILVGE